MSGWIIAAAVAIVWAVCAYFIIRMDKEMFPDPVIPGLDEMLTAITILAGPIGLLGTWVVYHDLMSRKRP